MFTSPRDNLFYAGLSEGMHVADFGTGSGAYVFEAPRFVRDGGIIYAVDIRRELLGRLQQEISDRRIKNAELICGDLEKPGGSKMANGSVDFGVISNTLFQVRNKPRFLAEVRRCLRSGGRVLVVDWYDSFGHLGPHSEHVLSPEQTGRLCEFAGLRRVKSIPAGRHHYGAVFEKIAA